MGFQVSGDAATTRTNLGLGDAATKTVGTGAGNVPVLDASGQIADAQIAGLTASKISGALPAISGANLTNLPASSKVISVKVSSSTTTQTQGGNTSEQWLNLPGLSNITHAMSNSSNMLLVEWTVPAKGNATTDSFAVRPIFDGAQDNRGGIYVMTSETSDGRRNMSPLNGRAIVSPGDTNNHTFNLQWMSETPGSTVTVNANYNPSRTTATTLTVWEISFDQASMTGSWVSV